MTSDAREYTTCSPQEEKYKESRSYGSPPRGEQQKMRSRAYAVERGFQVCFITGGKPCSDATFDYAEYEEQSK